MDDRPPRSTYYNYAYEQEDPAVYTFLWKEEGGGGGSEGTFLPKIEALHPENEGCLDLPDCNHTRGLNSK